MSGRKSKKGESTDFIPRLTNDLIHYMLVSDQSKVPVKRKNIVKYVMKENAGLFPAVLEEARRVLDEVFGFKLVELDKLTYILVNSVSYQPEEVSLLLNDSKCSEFGLLAVVLSVIFLKDGRMESDDVFRFLSQLGLTENHSKAKSNLDGFQNLINKEFINQGYLNLVKEKVGDNTKLFLEWGPRATAEFSPLKLVEIVCQLYGDDADLEKWKKYYFRDQELNSSRDESSSQSEIMDVDSD